MQIYVGRGRYKNGQDSANFARVPFSFRSSLFRSFDTFPLRTGAHRFRRRETASFRRYLRLLLVSKSRAEHSPPALSSFGCENRSPPRLRVRACICVCVYIYIIRVHVYTYRMYAYISRHGNGACRETGVSSSDIYHWKTRGKITATRSSRFSPFTSFQTTLSAMHVSGFGFYERGRARAQRESAAYPGERQLI